MELGNIDRLLRVIHLRRSIVEAAAKRESEAYMAYVAAKAARGDASRSLSQAVEEAKSVVHDLAYAVDPQKE